jgi:hypothetical protein
MADRELIAIVTAGMLPTLPIPRSRGPVTDPESETIQRAVGYAIGLTDQSRRGSGYTRSQACPDMTPAGIAGPSTSAGVHLDRGLPLGPV